MSLLNYLLPHRGLRHKHTLGIQNVISEIIGKAMEVEPQPHAARRGCGQSSREKLL